MKTYRCLYNEIISDSNIELAIREACKSRKKSRRKVHRLNNLKTNPNRITIVRNWIINYETIKRAPKEIYDGISKKKRKIYVPSVRETVVQHAVVQVLNKYLSNSFYEHSYAATRGKGQHKAKRRIEKYIRNHPEKCKYYFKMDIKQYFPSVSQKIIINKLEKQVKDYKVIELVRKILAASDDGIPLGFYISQWLANYYLTEFDHAVKQMVKKNLYIRWMDDVVIFSSIKRNIHRYKVKIEHLLFKLSLTIKRNWRIVRFSHGDDLGCFLDYMGFRFYRNRTTLRKSIYTRICRKARKISKESNITIFEIRQFMSYVGWISHTNMYKAYLTYIKPFINIQYMKRRISRYDKRKEKLNGLDVCAC